MRSFRDFRHSMLEVRVGVHHVPSQRHLQPPLSGQMARRKRQEQIEQPEERRRTRRRTRTPPAPSFNVSSSSRPEHLAQLIARVEHELPEVLAAGRHREHADARGDARDHDEPAKPGGLVRQHVVAGDASHHQRDADPVSRRVRCLVPRLVRSSLLLIRWQARRESNPNLRFWRPPLCQLSYWPNSRATAWDSGAGQNRLRTKSNVPSFSAYLSPLDLYFRILDTTPAPTVRPPSRMAKRRPASIAIGWISSTVILMLSPGITISAPPASSIAPVTSVVRK